MADRKNFSRKFGKQTGAIYYPRFCQRAAGNMVLSSNVEGSRFNAVVLLWSVKQWFYSPNFLPFFLLFFFFLSLRLFPRHEFAVFRAPLHRRVLVRRTRSGAILAFHTAERDPPPTPRSIYISVLCVKRTGKQNLRLFRKNKNGRARDAETSRRNCEQFLHGSRVLESSLVWGVVCTWLSERFYSSIRNHQFIYYLFFHFYRIYKGFSRGI